MKRKTFLTNGLLTAAAWLSGKVSGNHVAAAESSTYDRLMNGVREIPFPAQQVGFNHLPNSEINTMQTVLHKADSRGRAFHGWLESYHSFSFANYYHPERVHFGALRVLNDDHVAPGKGFGTHPHDNMEIISIPLEGDLEHKDSMGNVAVIRNGDIQVMSAGTGIYHSEYNKHADKPVKFLQIWLFPNRKGVQPRYDQLTLDPEKMRNRLLQILSPDPADEGVWIHQDAWFHMGVFDRDAELSYTPKKPGNGLYVFVLDGKASVGGQALDKRDGFGIWDIDRVDIRPAAGARLLLMDVPMRLS